VVHNRSDAVRVHRQQPTSAFAMGCLASKPRGAAEEVKLKRKMTWKSDEPMSREELDRKRSEFWDTQPYYGGDANVWLVLRAAVECEDLATAQTMLESAGVKIVDPNMTKCYDERGYCYELPNYVLADPKNLSK